MEPAGEHPLRRTVRPDFESGANALRVVDLFCGCGGLTLGVAQAANDAGIALDVALALDSDAAALATYEDNFPKANTMCASVESVLNGGIGRPTTKRELQLIRDTGPVHAVIGGPPCQGHSDLNNWTRRDDPKNELYLRMVRAVEVLRPPVLVVENVPAVRHATIDVVGTAVECLSNLGYEVASAVLPLSQLGVAQERRRHLLVATRAPNASPAAMLTELSARPAESRDLKWAIGDLADSRGGGLDEWPKASDENRARMRWLLDNGEWDLPNHLRPPCHQDGDHSYKSVYGRLRWDRPAQTITSGFTSIGQGRYMHPDLPRALTHHEAARIQGFPDYFRFSETAGRTNTAKMIGNAVPPALSRSLFAYVIAAVVARGEAVSEPQAAE